MLLLFVVAAIVSFIESTNILHFFMVAALIILAVVLLGILIRHYWLLLFVWLALPFAALWLAGDIMRPRLSLELHRTAKEVLVWAAFLLAIVNMTNMNQLQYDFGKRFIDGYQTIIVECEVGADVFQINSTGPCREEDLSAVAPSWRWVLRLGDWGFFILAFIVVVGTWLIGKSTVNRKAKEEWHEKHPDDERMT